jgi:hypothetical protein
MLPGITARAAWAGLGHLGKPDGRHCAERYVRRPPSIADHDDGSLMALSIGGASGVSDVCCDGGPVRVSCGDVKTCCFDVGGPQADATYREGGRAE